MLRFVATVLTASLLALAGCPSVPQPPRQPAATNIADVAIRNVTVVDIEHRRVLADQEILIRGDRIVSVTQQPRLPSDARHVIDGARRIAIPGFVNTHAHLWQHIAKGFASTGQLQQWTEIYRYAHYFTREELHDAVRAAASEGLLSGITTVSDFSSVNFSEFALDAVCDAMRDSKVDGNITWWSPAAFLPADLKQPEIERLARACGPRIRIFLGPGGLSFYRLPAVYDGIVTAKALNLRLTEHTMENVQEQRDLFKNLTKYYEEYGGRLKQEDRAALESALKQRPPSYVDLVMEASRQARRVLDRGTRLAPEEKTALEAMAGLEEPARISPIPLLQYLGALPSFVTIHGVWLTPSDIAILQKNAASVSHNPSSNQYLSSGIAPVYALLQSGVTLSLGTDGAASNDRIDMFLAMQGMWNLQKLETLDPEAIQQMSAWTVLEAATMGGARALGLASEVGSLAAGKQADIVLLSTERLGISPLVRVDPRANLVNLIVYSASSRDVDTVLSNGQIVVAGGQLPDGLESKLALRLSEIANNLVERQKIGKKWIEEYALDGERMGAYFVRYRSVRALDQLDLTVRNTGKAALDVRFLMSGTTFGGTVAATLSAEATGRFPEKNPDKFQDTQYLRISSGQTVSLKKTGEASYQLTRPDGSTVALEGSKSQQVAIVARML